MNLSRLLKQYGVNWTDYIKAMEGRRFYKPKIGN